MIDGMRLVKMYLLAATTRNPLNIILKLGTFFLYNPKCVKAAGLVVNYLTLKKNNGLSFV